jgi:hypothetical protein
MANLFEKEKKRRKVFCRDEWKGRNRRKVSKEIKTE